VEQHSKNLFKAISLSSERQVMLKKVSFSSLSPKKKEHIVNEVNTLIRLDYVHILRYLDYAINKKDVTVDIVMEYCRGGTLQDLIATARTEGRRIPEEEVWRIFYQLAQALEYVHSDSILHRNLDPAHVYFAEPHRKNLKLGGFSLSKRLDAEEDFSSTVLPQTHYLSPEQVDSGVCTKQTDVWALGCLIYELCALQPPFRSANEF
jgi:NIMA (never in mitosis gene a)-related kinase 2